MSQSFEFKESTHFTAGAIGEPGNRTFFLQVGNEDTYVSVKIEKQQVAALAGFLKNVLADMPIPDAPIATELIEPALPEWVVGQIAVGLDDVTQEIVLIVSEMSLGDEDEPDLAPEEAELRVHISPTLATSFVQISANLMAGGRPPCRLCGNPKNLEGHACPRLN